MRNPNEIRPESADAALTLLVRHLPEPQRTRALRRLLETLAAEGGPSPEWLDRFLEETGGDDPPSGEE